MVARLRLDALNVSSTSVRYRRHETVFTQGDRSAAVMYIQSGRVQLTATSPAGHKAVVAVLTAGEFFGEGVLAGQRCRTCTAETLAASTVAIVKTAEMRRRLRAESTLSDWFLAHMLTRNIRSEARLVGELFDHTEKRLARVLLLLTKFDEHQLTRAPLPTISRHSLAEMARTTPSNVDLLMTKFRKLGFLERTRARAGHVQVHCSMLSVVLQD
jgi:CRP/FNR family transcriptional regulator, cyclic AMP receptor protein